MSCHLLAGVPTTPTACTTGVLPARPVDTRQLAAVAMSRMQTGTARTCDRPPSAAAALAARVPRTRELRLRASLAYQCLLGHGSVRRLGTGSRALEQRPALVVVRGGGHDRDVHAADAVDPVLVDLVEHRLLGETEGVVAVAVELRVRQAAEVADAGQRESTAGGRGTPTCGRRAGSPCAPIGMPSRSLNCAIDFVALVTRLLAGDRRSGRATAPSISLASRAASPTPMLTTIFTSPAPACTLL